MTLNLQLSCYNGARYLPFLFASLKMQTRQDWKLFVLDNASDAENKKLIEDAVAQSGIPIELHRVEKNVGFAGAHTLLFEKTSPASDLVQLLNDDAILNPDFLERCVDVLEKHPRAGSVSGHVYRWNFDRADEPDEGKTQVIDSFGLTADIFGSVRDIGSGEQAHGTPATTSVLGVSGCLPMYRVSAVRRVSLDGGLFDRSYVSYKEDVELALRLRAAGYESFVVDTKAWHRRSYGLNVTDLNRPITENAYQSYRNHLWMWIVHMRPLSLVTNRIGFIPMELAKAVYWLFRQPSFVFRALNETSRRWRELMSKRRRVAGIRSLGRLDDRRPETPKADLAVIVVSHNDLNEKNLASIQDARRRFRGTSAIVVVDNASSSYDANALVEAVIPDAWTLLRRGDHGYGRSMNMGAAFVDAKAYFILNPDTILTDPDIFNVLQSYCDTHPDVGLVGPSIVNFTGELQDTCRRFPTWFQPLIQRTSLKKTTFGKNYLDAFLMRQADHSKELPVDWVQGSAMWLPGNVWKELHGFDDRYWLYFEDIDLCRRVWDEGLRVMYLPSVSIQHAHGRQSAKIQNFLLNILKTKETRGHLASWMKYLWKWRFETLPTEK